MLRNITLQTDKLRTKPGSLYTWLTMRIILLRHGPPEFKPRWLRSAEEAKRALDLYAKSHVSSPASEETVNLTSVASVVVSSELNRAVDSATLLGLHNVNPSDLFNESEIPHPDRLYISLPWEGFLILYRLLWLFGFRKNCPGKINDCKRAREASQLLESLAVKQGAVLLVGHGIMNRLICTELKNNGWAIDSKRGNGYWSSVSMSLSHP